MARTGYIFANGSKEISNPYRKHSIDASYQVLDNLDKQFQRWKFKFEKLMNDKRILLPLTLFGFAHGKMYSIQNYAITFDSDIRQVGGVL